MAKWATVGDARYMVGALVEGQVEHGELLYDTRNKKAWRALCIDGDEVVLRNMRMPEVVEADALACIWKHYRRLEPVA